MCSGNWHEADTKRREFWKLTPSGAKPQSYGVKGQDTDARGASGAGGKDAEALSAMEKRLTEVPPTSQSLTATLNKTTPYPQNTTPKNAGLES